MAAVVVKAVEDTTTTEETTFKEVTVNSNNNNISIMTIVTINSKGTTICHMRENNKCAIKLGYHHVNQTITTMDVTSNYQQQRY